MQSDRLHLENYHAEQIANAILELFKKYGLDASALPVSKWVKLGACLKVGEHDEFYLNNGGNEHIRRLDVVGHPSKSMNIVVVYGANDMPDYAKTRELRAQIYTHSHRVLCKPEEPMVSTVPQTATVRRFDSKPTWVRPGITMLPGGWYAIGDDIVHLAYEAEGWNMPLFSRVSLFATESELLDRDSGRNCLRMSTLNQVDAERYAALIEQFEAARQPA